MQIKGKLVELGEGDDNMGPTAVVFLDDCRTVKLPVTVDEARGLAPLLYEKVCVNFEVVGDLDAK